MPHLDPSDRDVARAFAFALRARFEARLLDIRVFGSRARGDATAESDLDVFVLLDRVSPDDWNTVLDLGADQWIATGRFVSPTVFDRALWDVYVRQERPLAAAIAREGICP